jgi:hypothetical protein
VTASGQILMAAHTPPGKPIRPETYMSATLFITLTSAYTPGDLSASSEVDKQ